MSNVLKKLRLEKGYTQSYMATMLGYKGKSSYCQIEKGKVKLTIKNAKMLSKIFNIDPMVFFED